MILIFLLIALIFVLGFSQGYVVKVVGNVVEYFNEEESMGPSAEQQQCMQSCIAVGCESGDTVCMTANSEKCGQQCGVDVSGPPEPADDGEACMQECVVQGCEQYDFSCQQMNKNLCKDKCGIKGDAPDESEMSEEQLCISQCIEKIDPTLICGSSQEGETGNEVCQKCADECVYLYSGPCLTEEELEEKENACISKCEHCYGAPVMGPSGQGWNCIIDIKCADASNEFGKDRIVVAIDGRKNPEGSGLPRLEVVVRAGSEGVGREIVDWAKQVEDLGAGEILLTSKDTDGTKQGYDLEMTRAVAEAVSIPVTASGGAGTLEHMYEAVAEGKASAVLAASIFHFGEISIPEVRAYLKEKGVPVRT